MSTPTPQESPAVTPPDALPAGFRPGPTAKALDDLANGFHALAGAIQSAIGGVIGEYRASRPICVLCAYALERWHQVNDLAFAIAQKMHADAVSKLGDGDKVPDLAEFLPEDIRPDAGDPAGLHGHLPRVGAVIATVDGTGICKPHLADHARQTVERALAAEAQQQEQPPPPPPAQEQGRVLLVPQPGVNVHDAAKAAQEADVTALPGMPGQ
jgi:hypothetical protein